MRLTCVFLVFALLWSAPAWGWESAREVIHGSARVLEKGETIIGVVSPLAYGVHERVTLFTHPALWLLLTPNLWFRLSLLRSTVGLALDAGYQQSFLGLQDTGSDSSQGSYPGFVQGGLSYSHQILRDIQLNLAVGYFAEFQDKNTGSDRNGVYYRGGGHFLFTGRYLLMAEIRGQVTSGGDWSTPTGTLVFAWQAGRLRVGAGACVGDFVIATGDMKVDKITGDSVADTVTLPVYPWVDVWWRF